MKLTIIIQEEEDVVYPFPYYKKWEVPIRSSRIDELALAIIKIINNFRRPPQMNP